MKIIYTILFITTLALLLMWTNARDEKIMEAADRYSKCIEEQEGQSPAQYYSQNNYYPTCK